MNLKRYFLIAMLGGLGLSAFIGIYIIIVGRFGETEIKLLMTTFDIGFFSLMALSASIWFDRRKFLPIAYAGLIVSAFALIMGLINIWGTPHAPSETLVRTFASGAISSIALAYVSLILLLRGKPKVVNNTIWFAAGCVAVVWFMLLGLIIFEWDVDDAYFRALTVFAILAVTATVAAPILKKVLTLKKTAGSGGI